MNAPEALLAHRYRLVRVIASGGMGIVWEAWDEHLLRTVAVKQLHTVPGIPEEEAELAKRRALREARITARLNHPHAVPVFDAVEHEGKPFIVMPLLPSTTLSGVLHHEGTLPLADAARIGTQVASALAEAHRLGIVHRDVKPGNILITPDGAAHISDFGISHALGDPTLTGSGMVHGTPAYLAPEVALGQEATFASDVFSLGSTLYAALEGEPPFGSEPNSLMLLHKVAAAQVRPPRSAGSLTPFLLQMLSRDPDARPTMDQAATHLAQLQSDSAPGEPTRPLPVVVLADPAAESGEVTGEPPTALAEGAPGEPESPASVEPPPEPGHRSTRRGPHVRVLVAALSVVAAVLLAVASLNGWFDGAPRAAANLGAATTPSVTSTPRATSTGPSPAAVATERAQTPTATTEPAPEPTATPEPQPQSQAETQSTPESARGGGKKGGDATAGAAQLASAVTSYYALMPENTDAAWPKMTADYQKNHAGGRSAYQAFWDNIARVSVRDVTPLPPDRAQATLTYSFRDGRVVVERTAFRFEEKGKKLRIAATQVLSSRGA
ncbi:protein kinase domain-containing protein [Xylanimonas sp. McL0601]|uniref:serine/threonine-protein kinase n=1 Tax=Xylanimonas sp. McL0601 TaxID=3414739 RepID=UPI003CEEBF51